MGWLLSQQYFCLSSMDAVLSYKTQERTLTLEANMLLDIGYVGILIHVDRTFDRYVSLSGQ